MKRLLAAALALAVVLSASNANAQTAGNPMMASVKAQSDLVKGNLTKTAAKVPESVWTFRATPDVRTFAQIVGHIVDANYGICGGASTEKPPRVNAEKTLTTKAELSKALGESFAFCDKVIASLDDKTGMEVVKFFSGPTTRAMVIAFNTAHDFEHYGNLVTYMRLNKIVPPSSEGTQ